MGNTRVKKVIQSGVTTEEMELAFAEYAKAFAEIQKITATMQVEITKIRAKYTEKLSELEEIKEQNFDILQAYAVEHQEELFTKKKSMDTVHGTLGFRTGTPKLKLRKGFTWGAVTNLLKEFLPAHVRTVEEPAKDKLLIDRDDEQIAALFPKVGIAVVQDETFFVAVWFYREILK
jgi:phage host-nuclease inhibitor protein Gam